MRNSSFYLFVLAVLVVGCHKPPVTTNPSPTSIVGRWNIDTVTTFFYDSTGLRGSEVGFPVPLLPDLYRSTFQFKADGSWTDSLTSTTQGYLLEASKGVYTITSDTSFTLFYPDATPARMNEPCHIVSLTNNAFIFTKQIASVFNGTDPGYTKYVFKLSRL